MYDKIFDRSNDRRILWLARILGLTAVAALASSADAQLPGVPVLQNAWATPGLVGAANFGGGSGQTVFAGAVGWSPGSGRFQLSGGAGYESQTDFDGRAVYGARIAMPFGGKSSSFGFGAFAGVGGGAARKAKAGSSVATGPTVTADLKDTVSWTTQIPVGAAVGYRRTIGSNHGISLYATPAWMFYSGGSKSGGLFRVGVGADIGITRSLGATLGADFGGTRAKELGGPSSTQYGVGVSYAFGHR